MLIFLVLLFLCTLLLGVILLICNLVAVNRCRRTVEYLTDRLNRTGRQPDLPSFPAFAPPAAAPGPSELPPEPEPAPEPPPVPPEAKAEALAAALAVPAPPAPPEPPPVPPAPPAEPFVLPAIRFEPEPEPELESAAEPASPGSEFERRAVEALRKIWNWIVVGEEFRPSSVAVEFAVATVWLVRAAVLLILIGLAYFVKYSHDHNLVRPELRIAGVVLLGLAVAGAGWKLARGVKYRLIGFGLCGVGVVTLYFAIFAATSIYHLLPVSAAFALMLLITVAGAMLALRLNALFVALVAVVGAYATPVMLSTGDDRFAALCGYLLLIGAGSLFLAFYRNWRLLNFVAFLLHYALFTAAIRKFFDAGVPADYAVVIGFGSGCFILFNLLPVLYSLVHRLKITVLETLLILANTTLYFFIAIRATDAVFSDRRYAAAVTVFAALFFAVEIILCFRFLVRDRNLYLSLLSLCSFAVALTVPLLLSSSWITAAWALQAAAMLYLGVRGGSRFLAVLAFILYFVAGFHAVMLTAGTLEATNLTYLAALFDRLVALGTYTVSLAAGCLIMRRAENRHPAAVVGENEPAGLSAIDFGQMSRLFLYLALAGFYALCRLEIARFPAPAAALRLTLAALLYLAVLGFLLDRHRRQPAPPLRQSMFAVALLALVDLALSACLTRHGAYGTGALLRLAGFVPFAAALGAIAAVLVRRYAARSEAAAFALAGAVLWFVYSSLELYRAMTEYLPDFATGALSVLWALYALLMLIFGIRHALRPLRYTALALFGTVGVKILLLDLARLPSLYRIAAFLAVGLLFFLGAFVYMRCDRMFRSGRDGAKEKV